ncbi:histone H3.v1-like [Papaver somniferum]|uniref:histone H3.v1-like n=1 Tax=Papaver somniferum TaxID=3469 RepID=UPI000E6F961A|nr:histone H3.v1-like [Papaver somniferum]
MILRKLHQRKLSSKLLIRKRCEPKQSQDVKRKKKDMKIERSESEEEEDEEEEEEEPDHQCVVYEPDALSSCYASERGGFTPTQASMMNLSPFGKFYNWVSTADMELFDGKSSQLMDEDSDIAELASGIKVSDSDTTPRDGRWDFAAVKKSMLKKHITDLKELLVASGVKKEVRVESSVGPSVNASSAEPSVPLSQNFPRNETLVELVSSIEQPTQKSFLGVIILDSQDQTASQGLQSSPYKLTDLEKAVNLSSDKETDTPKELHTTPNMATTQKRI